MIIPQQKSQYKNIMKRSSSIIITIIVIIHIIIIITIEKSEAVCSWSTVIFTVHTSEEITKYEFSGVLRANITINLTMLSWERWNLDKGRKYIVY